MKSLSFAQGGEDAAARGWSPSSFCRGSGAPELQSFYFEPNGLLITSPIQTKNDKDHSKYFEFMFESF